MSICNLRDGALLNKEKSELETSQRSLLKWPWTWMSLGLSMSRKWANQQVDLPSNQESVILSFWLNDFRALERSGKLNLTWRRLISTVAKSFRSEWFMIA